MAEKVARGEELGELEREWVAGILRAWAAQIPDAPARKRGQHKGDSALDPANTAMEFALLTVCDSMSANRARAIIAERWNCSDAAVKKVLLRHPEVLEWALRVARLPRRDKITKQVTRGLSNHPK